MVRFLRLALAILPLITQHVYSQTTDPFKDGNLSHNPPWTGDTAMFKAENGVLHLHGKTASDSAGIQTLMANYDSLEWYIRLSLGFSPSNNNQWRFYLASGSGGLKNGPSVYTQIGETGSEDAIELLYRDQNQETSFFRGLYHINKNRNDLSLKIRYHQGLWEIFLDSLGADDLYLEGSAFYPLTFMPEYLGIWCRYTKSNAASFWMSDLYAGPWRIDTQPPVLENIRVLPPSTLHLDFSEPVQFLAAGQIGNYSSTRGIGHPSSASRKQDKINEVVLQFATPFEEGIIYGLDIRGVKDLSGWPVAHTTHLFSYYHTSPHEVVINEVLFNPKGDGVDFVEIVNRCSHLVDLSGLLLWNEDENGNLQHPTRLTTNQDWLFPGEYVYFTTDKERLKRDHPNMIWDQGVQLTMLPPYYNDQGTVVLTTMDTFIIDRMKYNEEMHFPTLNNVEGVSLERIRPDGPSDDPSNWHSASSASGYATPGFMNSQSDPSTKKTAILSIQPHVFSPGNDGKNNTALIRYEMPEPGCLGIIRIYDAAGRLIRFLLSESLLGRSGALSWDGTNEEGVPVDAGIYIVCLQWMHNNGIPEKNKELVIVRF
ncbi:MAG: lamin tail domain-containing protein [Flavobacteriales bacterium]|nr:lamin tail domain-containing protein [Flavobacteriales bacterium]